MPVDAALIPKLREATLADLEDDYVNHGCDVFRCRRARR